MEVEFFAEGSGEASASCWGLDGARWEGSEELAGILAAASMALTDRWSGSGSGVADVVALVFRIMK